MDKIEKLKNMIDEIDNIVFFDGAGTSTLSGIKDFRSDDGLYNMTFEYPVEYMLSSDCFYTNTLSFYDFYKKYMDCSKAKVNIIHKDLKKLQDDHKLKAVVTQNIDGLHKKVGIYNVYELHGTIHDNYCLKCHKKYDDQYVFNSKNIPICECGGIIKPKVVLYGEAIEDGAYNNAIKAISEAKLLIVAGTSLTVEPARSLINLFNGKYLVIINKDKTPYDHKADLVINDDLKNVFTKLQNL